MITNSAVIFLIVQYQGVCESHGGVQARYPALREQPAKRPGKLRRGHDPVGRQRRQPQHRVQQPDQCSHSEPGKGKLTLAFVSHISFNFCEPHFLSSIMIKIICDNEK